MELALWPFECSAREKWSLSSFWLGPSVLDPRHQKTFGTSKLEGSGFHSLNYHFQTFGFKALGKLKWIGSSFENLTSLIKKMRTQNDGRVVIIAASWLGESRNQLDWLEMPSENDDRFGESGSHCLVHPLCLRWRPRSLHIKQTWKFRQSILMNWKH